MSSGSENTHSEREHIIKCLSHTITSKSFSNIRTDMQEESRYKANEVLYFLHVNELLLHFLSYNNSTSSYPSLHLTRYFR